MGSWLVGVGLRGFRLGIALGDSVRVREGLFGIAVGGRGVWPRNGEARDRGPTTAAASAAGHRDDDGSVVTASGRRRAFRAGVVVVVAAVVVTAVVFVIDCCRR